MIIEERIKLRDELFEEFKQLKLIYFSQNRYSFCNKNKIINNLKNKEKILQLYLLYVAQFRSEEEALYCLLHKDDFSNHLCPICNNLSLFYTKHPKIYRPTCGKIKCIESLANSDKAKKKSQKTCLKKYGVQHVLQNEIIKNKMKKTNLIRRGVEYIFQSDYFKRKSKETCLKRYGKEYASQSEEVKDKVKKTNLLRYGHKCSLHGKNIKKKIKNTIMRRYGVKSIMQSFIIQNKCKQTCLKRYGKEYASQSEEVKNKIRITKKNHFNVNNNTQIHIKHYDLWNNDIDFIKFIIQKYNEKQINLTLTEISSYFNVCGNNLKKKLNKLNLLQYFYIQQSNLEIDFEQFLNKNNIIFQKHNRNLLHNNKTNRYQEIDFFCEDLNIGFEINDIVTHNSLNINQNVYKNPSYHQNKSLLAKKNNIRLIHIWEWEIRDNNRWDKLSKWILNEINQNKIILNIQNITNLKQIDANTEKEFIKEYSIKRYIKSDICIGLYYNNELIQIYSFKRINNNQYELLCIITKYGYYFIDLNKILNNFIKYSKIESIIIYCNLDKDNYNFYEGNGFRQIELLQPNKIWCDKNMNLSNNQKKGYVPIYNSGVINFLYKLEERISKI